MFKDKYPKIFSPQMEAIVFIILQIFFSTRAVLKIGGYITIKEKNDHRSKFSNLSNWKEEA